MGRIAENLPGLVALDLSNLPEFGQTEAIRQDREATLWLDYLERKLSKSRLLKNLLWLGVPDWRVRDRNNPSQASRLIRDRIVEHIVPKCTKLKRLSIRGAYSRDNSAQELQSVHDEVCGLILVIAKYVSDSVSTVELRLSISFLRYFLEKLAELKPSIRQVGIDLGAWVQIYPLKKQEASLDDEEIRQAAICAAHQNRIDTYEEEHNKMLPEESGWYLPATKRALGGGDRNDYRDGHVYRRKQWNFYRDNSGTIVNPSSAHTSSHADDMSSPSTHSTADARDESGDDSHDSFDEGDPDANRDSFKCSLDGKGHKHTARVLNKTKAVTLPELLKKLQLAHHKNNAEARQSGGRAANGINGNVARGGAKLFALAPELQERSTDPLHPFALVQDRPETGDFEKASDYRGFTSKGLGDVLPWVEKTFKWRPVFDWDSLMVPVQREDASLAPRTFQDEWLLSSETDYPVSHLEAQFKSLKAAGITVHILIGRRDPDLPSCYWGWPYDESKWDEWKKQPFDANLEAIAPLIDSLSIFYDLRNPLDQERLEEIQAQQPHAGPHARCPQKGCPWKDSKNCPFAELLGPQAHAHSQTTENGRKQKMANRRSLKPKSRTPTGCERLASVRAGGPPTGENANDHPSDDSDSEDEPSSNRQARLLHLARRAAYNREALGWQRFWKEYALKFTSLTSLRVRMPRCFDKIGSWRLAKLLNQNIGWTMLTYTDERQHVQTSEDLVQTLPGIQQETYAHLKEAKVWPAGKFVRRAWVWDDLKLDFKESGPYERAVRYKEGSRVEMAEKHLELQIQKEASWADRKFTQHDEDDTQAGEAEEYAKADERANAAARRERAFENEHGSATVRAASGGQPDIAFRGVYGHHIRNTATGQWRDEIRNLAEELEHRENECALEAGNAQDMILNATNAEDLTLNQETLRVTQAEGQLLRNTRLALQRRLPYGPRLDVIFVEAAPGLKHGIGLQQSCPSLITAHENAKRDRPVLPFKGQTGTTPRSATVPASVQAIPTHPDTPATPVVSSDGLASSPEISGDEAHSPKEPKGTKGAKPPPEKRKRDESSSSSDEENDQRPKKKIREKAPKGQATSGEDKGTEPEPRNEPEPESAAGDEEVEAPKESTSKATPEEPGTTEEPKEAEPVAEAAPTPAAEVEDVVVSSPPKKTPSKKPSTKTKTTKKRKTRSPESDALDAEEPPPKRPTRSTRSKTPTYVVPPSLELDVEEEPEEEEESDEDEKSKKKKGKKRGSKALYVPHKDSDDDNDDDKPSGAGTGRGRGRGRARGARGGRGGRGGRGAGAAGTTGTAAGRGRGGRGRGGKKKAAEKDEKEQPRSPAARRTRQKTKAKDGS